MKKIEINSKTINLAIAMLVSRRGLFLIMFFGGLLVYSFNVIYNNAYLKLQYVDYSGNVMIFDGKRESLAIGKITDNLEKRDEIISKGLSKEYKNIFVYEDLQNKLKNSESKPDTNDSISLSAEGEINAYPVNETDNANGEAVSGPVTPEVQPSGQN